VACTIGLVTRHDRPDQPRGLIGHRDGGDPCGLSCEQIRQAWIDLTGRAGAITLRQIAERLNARGVPTAQGASGTQCRARGSSFYFVYLRSQESEPLGANVDPLGLGGLRKVLLHVGTAVVEPTDGHT